MLETGSVIATATSLMHPRFMKTVRVALWPLLENARQAVSPEIEAQLRAELAPLEKWRVAGALRLWRPLAMALTQATTARERRALIEEGAAGKPHWALYATAAWIARTLALAEYLEGADLSEQPKKWAASAALDCIDKFEDDETWLWPFDTEAPWAEPDADWEDDN